VLSCYCGSCDEGLEFVECVLVCCSCGCDVSGIELLMMMCCVLEF